MWNIYINGSLAWTGFETYDEAELFATLRLDIDWSRDSVVINH